jgi:hypothetical protein
MQKRALATNKKGIQMNEVSAEYILKTLLEISLLVPGIYAPCL